jgi:hypothetical protein
MEARAFETAIVILALCGCASRPIPRPTSETTKSAGSNAPGTPSTTLYLINGKELATGHSVRELDRHMVISVEHYIGAAAQLHGARADQDVVLITTRDTLGAARITKQ